MSGTTTSKIPKPVVTRTKSSTATATSTLSSGVPVRSRAALGDRTNAVKRNALDGKSTDKKGVKDTLVKEEKPTIKRKGVTSTASSQTSTSTLRPTATRASSRSTIPSTSSVVQEVKGVIDARLKVELEKDTNGPARKKRKTSSPVVVEPFERVGEEDELDEGHFDVDGKEILLSSGGKPVGLRSPKRERAKDEGWEDLDAEDEGDPSMVSEYVVDAFNYMMRIEVSHSFPTLS